ncbi:MAG: hydantoinase/oxoprolinase family protein [Pseudomonadota bacterium]
MKVKIFTIMFSYVTNSMDGKGGGMIPYSIPVAHPASCCWGAADTPPQPPALMGDCLVEGASIVLGYLDPDYFAGGTLGLQPDLAFKLIEEKIALPLELSVEEAALGIHRVVKTQMTEEIRLVTIVQGYDPREFALLSLGGAGGIRGAALAEELDIDRIVIAQHPGVLSAAGLLSALVEQGKSVAFPRPLDEMSLNDVRKTLSDLASSCTALMDKENVASQDIEIRNSADVCFVGQSHCLEVSFTLDTDIADKLYSGFRDAHFRLFGNAADAQAQVVNLRAIDRAGGDATLDEGAVAASAGKPHKGSHGIILAGHEGRIEANVSYRELMGPGSKVSEQSDSTTLMPPGWSTRALDGGNILLAIERRGVHDGL